MQVRASPENLSRANLMGLVVTLGAFSLSFNVVALTEVAALLKTKNNLTHEQLVFQLSVATSCFNLGAFLSNPT